MLSEWDFRFETRDLYLAKERHFRGECPDPIEIGGETVTGVNYSVRIVPSDDEPPPGIEQVGSLLVTVPFPPEVGRDLAYHLAHLMTQRVAFSSTGAFRINYALVKCQRIGETEEEISEIGDARYSLDFSMVEVVASPDFDSEAFTRTADADHRLLAQFNESRRDSSPIRQFLGFFRILESLSYGQGDKRPLRQALLSNAAAAEHFRAMLPEEDFEAFVGEIVDARHRCAHLKIEKGFGYSPTDPEIVSVVAPLLPALEELARRCIAR